MNEEKILSELAEIKAMLQLNKKVLNATEAAAFLGISKGSIYQLTHTGSIPHSKPTNGILYFDRDALTEWALSSPKKNYKQEAAKILNAKP